MSRSKPSAQPQLAEAAASKRPPIPSKEADSALIRNGGHDAELMAAQAIAFLPVHEELPPTLRIAEFTGQGLRQTLKRKRKTVRSAHVRVEEIKSRGLSLALGAQGLIQSDRKDGHDQRSPCKKDHASTQFCHAANPKSEGRLLKGRL